MNKYLLKFTPEQFVHWQTLCQNRTDTATFAGSVEIVMLRAEGTATAIAA